MWKVKIEHLKTRKIRNYNEVRGEKQKDQREEREYLFPLKVAFAELELTFNFLVAVNIKEPLEIIFEQLQFQRVL